MLIWLNAAGKAICPLIVTADEHSREVSRNGIEENTDLKIHVGTSAYVNHEIFHDYLKDVVLPHIEQARARKAGTAVLVMDNCCSHLQVETIQMLSEHEVKVITFRPHTSGIFQMLDLSFFGTFKRTEQSLSKTPELHFMADHADRMYRALEAARTTSLVRDAFMHAGITYTKHGESYILGYN
jgi:hypothetical protein